MATHIRPDDFLKLPFKAEGLVMFIATSPEENGPSGRSYDYTPKSKVVEAPNKLLTISV